jgi:hypothetical protein
MRSYGIPRSIDNSTVRGIINTGATTLPYNSTPPTNVDNTLGWGLDAELVVWMPGQAEQYRNVDMVPALKNNTTQSAEMFNALMLHRNGPYQYPSWKQSRTGQHPVARSLREQNIFSYLPRNLESVSDFVPKYDVEMLQLTGVLSSMSKIHPTSRQNYVTNIVDSPVASQYKPLIHEFGPLDSPNELILINTYANYLASFSNQKMIDELRINIDPRHTPEVHTSLMQVVENRQLPADQLLRSVTYQECVYPKSPLTYLKKIRQRENFTVDWWNNIDGSRRKENLYNSQGELILTASVWPLDGRFNWASTASSQAPTTNAEGELQNRYMFSNGLGDSTAAAATAVANLSLGVNYNRSGMDGGTADDTIECWKEYGSEPWVSIPWSAPSGSGKTPFYYDSYEDYAKELRVKGQDYSIVPEFRVSEHMDFYLNEKGGSWLSAPPGWLSLSGATIPNTEQGGFFNTYSTTDFMKMFDVVEESLESTAEPSNLTLKCKALMKFLPYEGFYPAQRTLQLATLFSQSYSGSIMSKGNAVAGLSTAVPNKNSIANRPIYQLMFAPGLLYNSIKAGTAVDMPAYTASSDWDSFRSTDDLPSATGDLGAIRVSSSLRLPFQTLVEPESYLGNKNFVDNELTNNTVVANLTNSLGPMTGKLNYKLAMHNFLAESVDFFLENGQMTTFASLPDNNTNFCKNVDPDKTYIMDIRLRASGEDPLLTKNKGYRTYPNYNGGWSMPYTNGNGMDIGCRFGPAVWWKDAGSDGTGGKIADGNNYTYMPFEPPALHMDAYARIIFTPPRSATEDQTYSLREILSNSEIKYYHEVPSYIYDECNPAEGSGVHGPALFEWSQISASINIGSSPEDLAIVAAQKVDYDAVTTRPVSVSDSGGEAWIIQPRWETPIMNFYSASLENRNCSGLVQTGSAAHGAPTRGMWHQYGGPLLADQGVFLEILDAADSEIEDAYNIMYEVGNLDNAVANPADFSKTGSLADILGFEKGSKKLGVSSDKKTIKEAIVAIPYQVESFGVPFYSLERTKIDTMIEKIQSKDIVDFADPERPLYDMVKTMQDYVIPPQFDFITFDGKGGRPEVSPISMYIFEFSHDLDREDITDIWQNLPPDIGTDAYFKESTSTISHSLVGNLKEQLLETRQYSMKEKKYIQKRDINNIRWLVFKVKQKGSWNYYDKTANSNDDQRFKYNFAYGGQNASKLSQPLYSYNWPYDFFSLVELIKIEAGVSFETGNYDDSD